MIAFVTFFHMKQSNFEHRKWFLSYLQKCMIIFKSGFPWNYILEKITRNVDRIFDTTNLMPITKLYQNLRLYLLNNLRNNPSKSIMVGPGRFIRDIDYMVKKMLHNLCLKNQRFLRCRVVWNFLRLWKEAINCKLGRNKFFFILVFTILYSFVC